MDKINNKSRVILHCACNMHTLIKPNKKPCLVLESKWHTTALTSHLNQLPTYLSTFTIGSQWSLLGDRTLVEVSHNLKPGDSWSMGCPSKVTYPQRTTNHLMLVLVVQAHFLLIFNFLWSQRKQGNSDVDNGVNYGIASFSMRSKSLFSHEMGITKIRGALVILPLFLIAKI